MISNNPTNYTIPTKNVSFGHSLKRAQRLITKQLIEDKQLQKLGEKVRNELPGWSNLAVKIRSSSKAVANTEITKELDVLNKNFTAYSFINNHLHRVGKVAKKPSRNISEFFRKNKSLREFGLSVRKSSHGPIVSYSDAFVKRYVSACRDVVENKVAISDFLEHFFRIPKKTVPTS